MKRAIFVCLALVAVGLLAGCVSNRPRARHLNDNCVDFMAGGGCECGECRGRHCRDGNRAQGGGFTPGPPTGQVAYPYYTLRGPRDFLMRNPPSIGP